MVDLNAEAPDSQELEDNDSRWQPAEKQWVREVVSGKNLIEALGSRSLARLATVRRYLAKPHIVDRLLSELALSGQTERVNEVLGYLAVQAARSALEKGDRQVVLSLLPKASGKAPKAAKEAPAARELDGGGVSEGKKD